MSTRSEQRRRVQQNGRPHHRARARRGQPQEIKAEIGDVDQEVEEELTWRVRYAPRDPTGFIRGPMGI